MKPSEVLFKAAELIEERGLAKAALEDGKGRFCVLGALCYAQYGKSVSVQSLLPASTYLRKEIGDVLDLADWNNAPERTPTEVIDTLRFAAKRALEDELARPRIHRREHLPTPQWLA